MKYTISVPYDFKEGLTLLTLASLQSIFEATFNKPINPNDKETELIEAISEYQKTNRNQLQLPYNVLDEFIFSEDGKTMHFKDEGYYSIGAYPSKYKKKPGDFGISYHAFIRVNFANKTNAKAFAKARGMRADFDF